MYYFIVRKQYYRNFLLLLFTALLFSCGGGSSSNKTAEVGNQPINADFYQPASNELPVATATEVGLNEAVITSTYQMAKTQPDLRSMLIVKDNKLIAEAYFNGNSSNTKLHLRSVTKTVTAMLIGIAIEQGLLIGPEQTIGEFFIQDFPNFSSDKADITIANLLTMNSGFSWDEGAYLQWESSADPVAYLVNRSLFEAPGSSFHYNSAAVHLLAVILDKVTNGGLDNFAKQNLFTPLGIDDYNWSKLRDGRVNGGAGLQLRPIDTAKLAIMLLNNGLYNESQIVPELWVKAAKNQQVEFSGGNQFGDMNFTGYGYLWWQGTGNNRKVDLAWGWGGQFIATVQENGLIVITNSRHNVVNSQADIQEKANFALIVNGVFAALD